MTPQAEEAVNVPEDPSLTPTLILSPDKVLAYRSRVWNQGPGGENAPSESVPAENAPDANAQEFMPHIADQPTVIMPPASEPSAPPPAGANNSLLADQPTLHMSGLPEAP